MHEPLFLLIDTPVQVLLVLKFFTKIFPQQPLLFPRKGHDLEFNAKSAYVFGSRPLNRLSKFEITLKVHLNYGSDNPLAINCQSSTEIVEMRGPEGFDVDASVGLVRDALLQPVAGPALPDHVVPGDRVVIAQAGHLPGGQLIFGCNLSCHFGKSASWWSES